MEELTNVGITIEDECVKLSLAGGLEFKYDLDDRGLLEFPESVKQHLPSYMPEMVEEMVRKMRSEYAFYAGLDLVVEHKDNCTKCLTEYTRISICTCNPVLREQKIPIYKRECVTLTCGECGESSTGNVERITNPAISGTWLLEVWKDGRPIKVFWDHAEGKLMCGDCNSRIMQD